jgi:hypothetical protein
VVTILTLPEFRNTHITMDATEALRRAASRWQEREAMRDGTEGITFAALDARVNRLAHYMARSGSRPVTASRRTCRTPSRTWWLNRRSCVRVRCGRVNRRPRPGSGVHVDHAAVRVVLADGDGLER